MPLPTIRPLALITLLAASQGFAAGVSVEGEPCLGELGINTDNPDPFDDGNFIWQIQDSGVVGAGIEIVLVDPFLTGDFSQTGDTLTAHLNAGFSVLPFNGLRFSLTDAGAPAITSVTLLPSSTFPGFDASRLSFQGSRLAMNFSGLNGVGDVIVGIVWEAGAPCPGDIDDDGTVGTSDLLALLAAWGPNPGHAADLDGDDNVGTSDLLALLAAWGPCP